MRREIRAAAIVFLCGAAAGAVYSATWGRTPHFYQEIFGPAVLWACGHDFLDPVPGTIPPLDAFLNPDVHADHPPLIDRFDCGALPDAPATQPLIVVQRAHRYLLFSVAMLWRLFGVAWSALAPLYGLLFGMAALALYGIFRLALPRWAAAACALVLAVSPLQLNNLVRLRDYSKAPFILGALFLMGLLVSRPLGRKTRLALCATGGALLGLGLGFRMDVSMALPAFLVMILLFQPGTLRATWRERLGGVVLLVAAFLAVGAPIVSLFGYAQSHWFLMGQAEIYDARLGVGGVPYQVVHRYYDAEPRALLQAHHVQQTGEVAHYGYTPEYDAVGRDYLHRYLSFFPADQPVRALAAVWRTIDEMGPGTETETPRGIENAFLGRLYRAHMLLLRVLLRCARYAAPLALLLLLMRSPRLGLGALFLLLYFAGHSAIQFASRHNFYMQFVALWAVSFLLYHAAAALPGAMACLRTPGQFRARLAELRWPCLRAGLLAIAVTAAAVLSVAGLRAIQVPRARGLIETYENAALTPVPVVPETVEKGETLLKPAEAILPPIPASPEIPAFSYAVFMAEFDTTQGEVPFFVRYNGNVPDAAITWGNTLPKTEGGPTRVYFPVYNVVWNDPQRPWTQFEGIQLTADQASRLLRVARVTNPRELPMLLTLTLPPDWRTRSLFQHFVR